MSVVADALAYLLDPASWTGRGGMLQLLLQQLLLTVTALLAAVATTGAEVSGVEVRSPDLEDVFLHVTGRALRD